jgi:hypothetical protein
MIMELPSWVVFPAEYNTGRGGIGTGLLIIYKPIVLLGPSILNLPLGTV